MTAYVIISAIVIFIDQLTKYISVQYLKPIGDLPLIDGILHLSYVENSGAAFGMFSENRWIFMSISTIAIIALTVVFFKCARQSALLKFALAIIIGGGIGNMIDRCAQGYVVDFIYFKLINFAVFNFADMCVCIGVAAVALWLITQKEK